MYFVYQKSINIASEYSYNVESMAPNLYRWELYQRSI